MTILKKKKNNCLYYTLLNYFCTMRTRFSILLLFVVAILHCDIVGYAQGMNSEEWTLQRTVAYALENNISIKQSELNKRLSELSFRQSQWSQLPNINANTQYGRSFGRSVDPTTNQFVNGSSYDYLTLSGNVDVLVFGWFQRRNTIAQNKYSLQAANSDLDQLKDDVSLNVATGYLRALLAKEQVKINQKKVELSKAQLEQTIQFARAGRVPELNVAQLESQLASDSSLLITAITDYNASILDIKALLNLDFDISFDVVAPQIPLTDALAMSTLSAQDVYLQAASHFGRIKSSEQKVIAARKGLAAAKGALYPRLSLTGNFGTNWASTVKEFSNFNVTGTAPTGNFVPVRLGVGDTILPVYQYKGTFDSKTVSINTQFDNNFRQGVAINLNVPIFNGLQSRTAVKRARINVQSEQLNKYQNELQLKQDVYKAYNNAQNAIQKYQAAVRAVIAARRAYGFAEKRYKLGLSNTVEYLTTQNNLYTAESNLASTKYDLIFKLKVIDYYLGEELKL